MTSASGKSSVGGTSSAGGTTSATSPAGGTSPTDGNTWSGGTTSVSATSSSSSAGTIDGGGAATTGGTATAATSSTTLKKFIGNISSKNMDIQADFATKWQQVAMEANAKWRYVQPDSADEWVWDPVDKVYQYAKDHGIIFKQHTFFWAVDQPSWVDDSNIMTAGPAWVKAFCKRYPDVAIIDVVNEALPGHSPAPYASGMGGTGASGFDWVIQAFNWARQYCPHSILLINDCNTIEYEADNSAFINMMQALMSAGAQIDAIGAQGHDVYKIGAARAKTYIDKLVTTFNLPIYITEVDINTQDDDKQLAQMQDEMRMFWDHPNIMGITYWGYVKGTTWRNNAWLEDTDGTPRPAMTWLQDFIHSH
jgi:endo-1,4-beta-xylanase